MTRICITRGPRTGMTTLARTFVHVEIDDWLDEHGVATEYR